MQKKSENIWNLSCRDKDYDPLNKKQALQKITVERLRQFKGCENVSDDEANNIIETLFRLSVITYNCHIEQMRNEQSDFKVAA